MADHVRLVVVGLSWPMETFLEQLLRGLAMRGFQITLATENRPTQSWLKKTGIEWLSAPLWRGSSITTIGHLIIYSLRTLFFANKDGRIFWRATLSSGSWKSR